MIFEVQEKKVISKNFIENRFTGHARELEGNHHADHHGPIISALRECDVVISKGMGPRIFKALVSNGIKPYITDEEDIETALNYFIEGKLKEIEDFRCKNKH